MEQLLPKEEFVVVFKIVYLCGFDGVRKPLKKKKKRQESVE